MLAYSLLLLLPADFSLSALLLSAELKFHGIFDCPCWKKRRHLYLSAWMVWGVLMSRICLSCACTSSNYSFSSFDIVVVSDISHRVQAWVWPERELKHYVCLRKCKFKWPGGTVKKVSYFQPFFSRAERTAMYYLLQFNHFCFSLRTSIV